MTLENDLISALSFDQTSTAVFVPVQVAVGKEAGAARNRWPAALPPALLNILKGRAVDDRFVALRSISGRTGWIPEEPHRRRQSCSSWSRG